MARKEIEFRNGSKISYNEGKAPRGTNSGVPAPATHKCTALGCTSMVPVNLLMCNKHWRMVGTDTQHEINKLWRLPKTLENRKKHLAACKRAVQQVRDLERDSNT